MYEQLAKGAFEKWKKNKDISLIPVIWMFLIGFVLVALLVAVAVVAGIGFLVGSMMSMEMGFILAILLGIPATAGAILVYIYALAAYQATLYTMADAVLNGKKMHLESAVSTSKKHWGKFFKFTVLQAIVGIVAFAVAMVPTMLCLAIAYFKSEWLIAMLILGLILTFMVGLVIFLYLAFMFFFSYPILLYEKESAWQALVKCKEVLHKKPKHVVISFFVAWLVSMAFAIVMMIILLPIYAIALIFSPIQFIASIIQGIAQAVLLVPWLAIFQLSAYKKK